MWIVSNAMKTISVVTHRHSHTLHKQAQGGRTWVRITYFAKYNRNLVENAPPDLSKKAEFSQLRNGVRTGDIATSIQALSEAAIANGLRIVSHEPAEQSQKSCACNVFYPHLRGDKIPYEAYT